MPASRSFSIPGACYFNGKLKNNQDFGSSLSANAYLASYGFSGAPGIANAVPGHPEARSARFI